MFGLLFKVDNNGNRQSKNVIASFENYGGTPYFKTKSFSAIGINNIGDRFIYSDNDIEINDTHQVTLFVSDSMVQVIKV